MIFREAVEFTSAKFFGTQPRWPSLLRLGLTFGMLIAAPLVGILAAKMDPVLIFALIGLLALPLGLQSVLQRPSLAPAIILIAAAFLPISLPTGTGSRLVDSLLLTTLFVALWTLRMLTVERRLHLIPSVINKPLLGFMVIVVVSLLWSMAFRDPLVTPWNSFPIVQAASTVVMIMLPGAFLLVANHVNNLRLLKAMVVIFLVAGIIGLVADYALPGLPINRGGLFTMWVVAFSTAFAGFNRDISPVWRGLLLALAGAWVYRRFGQEIYWMVGWLPTFVALGVLAFMRSKKLLIALSLVLVVIIASNFGYYLQQQGREATESGDTRAAAWIVNWRITGNHLLFGTGPAGYAAYYMSYYPQEAMATHSNYIDIVAQTGIIGLGLCVWFFFRLAWLGYKLCLRLRERGDFSEAAANAALAGTMGCIVAMAFGDWLFPFAYTQTIAGFDYAVYNWLFMGMIPVLERLTLTTQGTVVNA
jgi:hypothetical protein